MNEAKPEPRPEKRGRAPQYFDVSSPVKEPLGSKVKIEEVADLIAAIDPNEEPNLDDEIEMPEPVPTETEEMEAKMAEIGRFEEYGAFEAVWPEKGDKVLS